MTLREVAERFAKIVAENDRNPQRGPRNDLPVIIEMSGDTPSGHTAAS